jgi:hypothetical protein
MTVCWLSSTLRARNKHPLRGDRGAGNGQRKYARFCSQDRTGTRAGAVRRTDYCRAMVSGRSAPAIKAHAVHHEPPAREKMQGRGPSLGGIAAPKHLEKGPQEKESKWHRTNHS